MLQVPESWTPGWSQVRFMHRENSVILAPKSKAIPESITLHELCQQVTPPCILNPLLFNGHLHTAWAASSTDGPLVVFKRHIFKSDAEKFPGHFAVDFVVGCDAENQTVGTDPPQHHDPAGIGHNYLPPRTSYFTGAEFDALGSDDSEPMLIVLHGLSGGSYESYLRQAVGPLVTENKPCGQRWHALIVTSRGCAGSRLTSHFLYNARSTWDVGQVVKWTRSRWPNRPLFGLGFSLGANILTNYIAEEGAACILSAAVVVSTPWNLDVGAKALRRTWMGMEVYSQVMGKNMRNLVELHREKIFDGSWPLDEDKIRKGRYLYEFDRDFHCAIWGYATETSYYRDASCCDGVLGIKIPFFAIQAADDPITPHEAIPLEEIQYNPYVVLCSTTRGGHLGWFEIGGGRWYARVIERFFNTFLRDVDLTQRYKPKDRDEELPLAPFQFDPLRRKASFV